MEGSTYNGQVEDDYTDVELNAEAEGPTGYKWGQDIGSSGIYECKSW